MTTASQEPNLSDLFDDHVAAEFANEHIYWDRASLLMQIGLLDPGRYPATGVEQARALTDPGVEMNSMITGRQGA